MEVRAGNGKGPLLFTWDPENNTVNLVRKDMYYSVRLTPDSYCVREECPKYNADNSKSKN